MTKKKVPLNRSEEMESVDIELDAALDRLVDANQRIDTLLTTIESGSELGEPEPDDSVSDDAQPEEAAELQTTTSEPSDETATA